MANSSEELTLVLGRRFGVLSAQVNGTSLGPAASMGKVRAWRVFNDKGLPRRIEVHWRGELTPLDTSLDHAQTLGRDEPASGEAGTFLPDSSGWYPYIAGKLASYRVSIELPAGNGRLFQAGWWKNPNRLTDTGHILNSCHRRAVSTSWPVPIASKRYDARRRRQANPVANLLPPSDRGSCTRISGFGKGYIDLYESWIGEYPFSEFSVVSSPTPTGFGMPTLTYPGNEVLRLPFIRYTSLGHEVLHNWWGNGVYPDYAHGNWSEGLTTFMADYAYKERENAEAAMDMRRGWLRDFAALSPGRMRRSAHSPRVRMARPK